MDYRIRIIDSIDKSKRGIRAKFLSGSEQNEAELEQ